MNVWVGVGWGIKGEKRQSGELLISLSLEIEEIYSGLCGSRVSEPGGTEN